MARRRMQAVLQSIARPWPWLWELGWQNQWRSLAVERDEDDAGDCELRSKNFSRTCAPIKTSKTVRKSSSDAHSAALQYVWRILCLVRPWSVLYLSALSVAEALVVARVGQVAGSFYKIVVDKNSSALFEMLLQSSLLYALCIGLAALADWLEALLALAWRAELSERLHSSYCHAAAFAHLGRHWAVGGETDELEKSLGSQSLLIQGSTLAVTMPVSPLASSSALPVLLTVPAPPLDNPDQRMTSDVRLLTESLAVLARLAASTPVKAAYYSLLTRRLLGWVGLLAVYAGFVLGALAQAAAALAASRVVARREAAEGDLRAAHARLRALREAAGLAVAKGGGWEWSRGMEGEHVESWPARDDRSPAGFAFASSEHAALSAALARLLREQRRVAGWRAALTLVSKAVDYGGALLNYSVVGAAVFAGAADAWDGGSGGATAEFVSNASFASMSLIYAFTELADKGEKMAAVAGVAVRVGGLLDAVRGWEHGAAEEGEVGEGEVAEEENGNVPEEVDASAPESTTLLQRTQPSSDPTILFEIDALTLRVNPSSGGPEIRAAPHSPTRLLPLRSPPLPSPARVLVQSLSLRLRRGRCVLVSGPNGCGKSSLLRALAGLEPTDPGSRISRPSRARLFFAAQTPLAAPLPSLPAQLAYPAPPPPRAELSPRERAVLNAVGLEGLAQAEPRISSGAWSPGELQRLAFARCLLRRPALDLALLDEPTSAVGVQAACQLFGLLRAAGVTYLSVGQDCEHLRRVHDSHLRFSGREGDWELKELPEA